MSISASCETCSSSNNLESPFIIGVSGGTSAGKTAVCEKIVELLGESSAEDSHRQVAIIHEDSFYKSLTPAKRKLANQGLYNLDHPDAFDINLMKTTLDQIIEGNIVKIPKYNFLDHIRKDDEYDELHRCDVVLFEGILIFYHKEIRDLFNLRLFVDRDADTRLSRRVLCDVERGKTLESVLQQYTSYIKPAFEEFCLPSKKYADVIIPRGIDNKVAINLIVQHIRDFLNRVLVKRTSVRRTFSNEVLQKEKSIPRSMGRPH